ncbi:MAG: hypothetical protein ACKOOG_05765, partial [Actinomycetota bacterium]
QSYRRPTRRPTGFPAPGLWHTAPVTSTASDLAALSSTATQIAEIAARITDLAESYGTTPDSAVAGRTPSKRSV